MMLSCIKKKNKDDLTMTILKFKQEKQSTAESCSKYSKQKISIPGMDYQNVLKKNLKNQSDLDG